MAFLAGVGSYVGQGCRRRAPPLVEALVGGVDLDHPRPEVGQHGSGVRPGLNGRQIEDGHSRQRVSRRVSGSGLASRRLRPRPPQASQHFGSVLSNVGRGSARHARRVREFHQRRQRAQRTDARIIDRGHGPVGEHRGMIHGLDAVAIGLRGDFAVLQINLHPLVGGLLQLLLQYLPAQQLAVLRADGGNTRESLILEQVLEADRLEMALDVRDALIGVLQPHAILGPHGNVANAGLASAAGRARELRVPAAHLDVHQPAITDIVVVGRGQALDDAGLDPLPTPADVPHAKGGDDAAQRRLAGVPAAGRHRRIHRAITVGLPLQIEHATCLGRNDPLVPFDPARAGPFVQNP